ncbi:MAG: addiction module protein [Rhodospirillales bacterium]|nr:addiction module protein [Rhodospirillales bacterium]
MNELVEELSRRARDLPPKDRVELLDDILASLDAPDERLDAAWAAEAESRLEAYRRGELNAMPIGDILAKHRTP